MGEGSAVMGIAFAARMNSRPFAVASGELL